MPATMPPSSAANRTRILLWLTAGVTALLLILGILMRSEHTGSACPDWPTCLGSFGVPAEAAAQIAWGHRALALVAGALGIGAVWMMRKDNPRPETRFAAFLGLGAILAAALVGALRVWNPGWTGLGMVHALPAGLALSGFLFAAVTSSLQARSGPLQADWRSSFTHLALAVSLLLVVLTVSGLEAAQPQVAEACLGWPLCDGGLPTQPAGWVAFVHRLLALAGALLVIVQFVRAWQVQRTNPLVLPAASAALVMVVAQAGVGALKLARGFPPDLVALHAVAALGLWVAQVITLAGALFVPAGEQPAPVSLVRKMRDFFILAKPGIVLLMLVTTFAGMVLASQGWPPLGLTAWTIFGGALAAGGASALNQYIDRDLDKLMSRTSRRPLPSGRLHPSEAFAFGTTACLVSFFVLAATVNLLAAVLALAGMVYYAGIYSVWLKRLNEHNTVIGGGAGSIPPLVGWAAVTGNVGLPAVFLFAIVFFWSPPHFWALAILRKNDYKRSGIPMLPVVRGDEETRKQIFIYSLILVAITLAMPALGMSGWIFLGAGLALGFWLLWQAGRLLRKKDNPSAWAMFRSSSMYLLLLFGALVLDALVRIPLIAG